MAGSSVKRRVGAGADRDPSEAERGTEGASRRKTAAGLHVPSAVRRKNLIVPALLVVSALAAWGTSRLSGGDAEVEEPPTLTADGPPPPEGETEAERRARERAALEGMLEREFPMHGIVTAAQLRVRSEPDGEALTLGWLRLGGHVRMRREPRVAPRCATGWYELYPRGWVCAGQGVDVSESAPETTADMAADTDSPLPYRYMFVRDPQTPEYHQLPSRDDQRDAIEHGRRYAELLNDGQERRAGLLREGRLAGEPRMPAVVARYLHRGFYVAGNGVETRSSRRFVRTVRGSYVKEAQLEETSGASFQGVELDEETTLPIAWATRTAAPLERQVRADGSERMRGVEGATPWERQERVPWLRRERIGAHVYHVVQTPDGEERFLRAWFVGVAEAIDPPRSVGADDVWVHVDVSEQTLVMYRGARPFYATLVSSGLEGHDTPRGEFHIRRKFVSDTMANLGPDAGDDSYRIDDVPWTQYFDGSIALHGAFWHNRFGLQRSHGCVNLAPRDARYVFEHTAPEVPLGWHGVSTDRGTGFEGSLVVVTD